MKAGRLKERLEILDLQTSGSDFSSKRPVYVARPNPIRAELKKQTGRQEVQAAEIFASYSAEFNIREEHQLKEGDRVRHLCSGGLLYKVENVLWNRERRMKTLQCTKVNQ